MSSIESGVVHSVWTEPAGSGLREDVSSGSIDLPVADANDFDEDGGWLSIEGEDFEYVAADKDENVITLAEVTESAYEEGTPVLVAPLAEEKWAEVQLDGEDEPIEVEVPEMFWRALPDGIRDHSRLQWVDIEEYLPDEFRICKIHGGPAPEVYEFEDSEIDFVQGLQDGTIGGGGPASDGEPPATPTLEVTGGVGAFHVRVTPAQNPDPVIFDLYVADEDPGSPVVVDELELYAEDIGTSTTLRYKREIDPDTGEPVKFAYDTDYWFYVVPREEIDGPGEPTPAVSAQLVRATNEDISAEYVYAGELTADQITGGTINADVQIAGSIKTATSGARVELNEAGLTSFDSNNDPAVRIPTNGPALFTGDVSARVLTAREGAELQGDANSVAAAGALTLAAGTLPPAEPPVISHQLSDVVTIQNRTFTGLAYFNDTTTDPKKMLFASPYPLSDGSWSGWHIVGQNTQGPAYNGTLMYYVNLDTGEIDPAKSEVPNRYVYGFWRLRSREYFRLERSLWGDDWMLWKFDPNGTELHSQTFVRDTNANGYPPVLTYDEDADQIVIAEQLTTGFLRIRRYSTSLGAPVSSVITSGQAYTSGGLGGILSGQLDLASSDRYVVAPRDRTHDFKVFNQAGSPQAAEGWKSPGTANVRVLARQTNSSWGFAGIRAILNDGTIWQYPVQSTTGAYDPGAVTKKLWVAYTWENAEGAHTTLGPKTDFDYWRRYELRLTAPVLPDGVDQWSLYLAEDTGLGPPSDNNFHRVATLVGRTFEGYIPADTFTAGDQAPVGNTFPADTPAVLRSAGNETVISGNGDVQVGAPITLYNEDWHYVGESGEPAFNGDWKNDLVTERRLRFRKDAAGVVWILGQVSRSVPLSNGNGDARVIFTLPEAYRPVETVSGYLQFQQMTGTNTPEKFGSVTIHSDGRVQFWPENHAGGTYLSVLISYLP